MTVVSKIIYGVSPMGAGYRLLTGSRDEAVPPPIDELPPPPEGFLYLINADEINIINSDGAFFLVRSGELPPIIDTAPYNTAPPVISGSTTVGSTLITTNGTWTGTPTPTFTYQWKRDGIAISGEITAMYLVVTADVGETISVEVTATNAAGSATAIAVGVAIPPVSVGAGPVLTWMSDFNDLTPVGSVIFDNVPIAGDILTSQIQLAGGSWSSLVFNNVHTITATEDTDNVINLANTVLSPDSYDWRVRTTHASVDSPWSNIETKTLVAFTPATLSPALWFEVGKGGLFQSNAGTTAASANGNVVGYLPDQSGNSFTLTSAANDTTRPLLQGVGSFPYLDFDGSNDLLRRLSNIGSITGGAFTWAICYRSNGNAVSSRLMAEGGATCIQSVDAATSPATSSSGFWRNDASGSPTGGPAGSNFLQANAFNGTDRVLIVTWDGTTYRTYLDGIAGPTGVITSLGTFTPTSFAIGALYRTSATNWWKGRIYGGVVVNSVLSTTDRNKLITYLGELAGLNI